MPVSTESFIEVGFEAKPLGAVRQRREASEEADLAEVVRPIDEFVEVTQVVEHEGERVGVRVGGHAVR